VVGNSTATAASHGNHNITVEVSASTVDIDDLLESLDPDEGSANSATYLPLPSDDDEHRNIDDEDGYECGTSRCEAGQGHCQQMSDGPLCVCVEGYYGPDCQQRAQFTASFFFRFTQLYLL